MISLGLILALGNHANSSYLFPMKFLAISLLPFCVFNLSLSGQESTDTSSASAPFDAINPADFLSEALNAASTQSDDPMGTQRLIQVKDSSLTPMVNASSSFKYSSNPNKVKDPTDKDGTSLDLSLDFKVGLGEYGLGDDVLAVPAFSLMKMRTLNDPVGKFGEKMKTFDVDVLVVSLSVPLVLPDDFTLTIGHSYVAPTSINGPNELISTSNTPSIAFAKNFPLTSGDVISVSVGASYTFFNGDSLKEQTNDPVYYEFLNRVYELSNQGSLDSDYPYNLQSGLSHIMSISYMSPVGEKLTLIPSFTYNNMMFTEGAFKDRSDKTYNLGLVASYAFYDWLNATAMATYTWKTSSDNVSEYEDLLGGLSLGVSHAF